MLYLQQLKMTCKNLTFVILFTSLLVFTSVTVYGMAQGANQPAGFEGPILPKCIDLRTKCTYDKDCTIYPCNRCYFPTYVLKGVCVSPYHPVNMVGVSYPVNPKETSIWEAKSHPGQKAIKEHTKKFRKTGKLSANKPTFGNNQNGCAYLCKTDDDCSGKCPICRPLYHAFSCREIENQETENESNNVYSKAKDYRHVASAMENSAEPLNTFGIKKTWFLKDAWYKNNRDICGRACYKDSQCGGKCPICAAKWRRCI